jgi:hypothetical protein
MPRPMTVALSRPSFFECNHVGKYLRETILSIRCPGRCAAGVKPYSELRRLRKELRLPPWYLARLSGICRRSPLHRGVLNVGMVSFQCTMAFAYTADGKWLDMTRLDWWADVATIGSGVIALLFALIGSGGAVAYLVNRYTFRRKSKAVEEYLKDEKAKMTDRGQRSAEIIRIKVEEDLTEDEIYKIGRSNPRILMRVKVDEHGFADKTLYEYICEE